MPLFNFKYLTAPVTMKDIFFNNVTGILIFNLTEEIMTTLMCKYTVSKIISRGANLWLELDDC